MAKIQSIAHGHSQYFPKSDLADFHKVWGFFRNLQQVNFALNKKCLPIRWVLTHHCNIWKLLWKYKQKVDMTIKQAQMLDGFQLKWLQLSAFYHCQNSRSEIAFVWWCSKIKDMILKPAQIKDLVCNWNDYSWVESIIIKILGQKLHWHDDAFYYIEMFPNFFENANK